MYIFTSYLHYTCAPALPFPGSQSLAPQITQSQQHNNTTNNNGRSFSSDPTQVPHAHNYQFAFKFRSHLIFYRISPRSPIAMECRCRRDERIRDTIRAKPLPGPLTMNVRRRDGGDVGFFRFNFNLDFGLPCVALRIELSIEVLTQYRYWT